MTCCVAALCAKGNAIALITDKRIGMGAIATESALPKYIPVAKNWFLLYSGDDISSIFDISDRITRHMASKAFVNEPDEIGSAVARIIIEKRLQEAEALYLRPLGLTLAEFVSDGINRLHKDYFETLARLLESYRLPIAIILAGFASNKKGYLISVDGEERIPRRHDNPGFVAIGSGAAAAIYWMSYYDAGPVDTVREALFLAFHGKYFAELGSEVGEYTAGCVVQYDTEPIELEDKWLDKYLVPICKRLSPKQFSKTVVDKLNALPRLEQFPPAELDPDKGNP